MSRPFHARIAAWARRAAPTAAGCTPGAVRRRGAALSAGGAAVGSEASGGLTAWVDFGCDSMDATTTWASTRSRSMPPTDTRSQASMTMPLSRTRSSTSTGWVARSRSRITPRSFLHRHGHRAVDLYRHTARHELDREDQQALVRPGPNEDALHVGHGPAGDAHALPFLQEGVGQRRQPAVHDPLDGVDLARRHRRATLPAVAEDRHQAPRLAHFDIAPLVQRVVQEQIAREHRHPADAAPARPPRPQLEGRQEDVEAPADELIVNELLAVAARPEHVPAGCRLDRATERRVDQRRRVRDGDEHMRMPPSDPVRWARTET